MPLVSKKTLQKHELALVAAIEGAISIKMASKHFALIFDG